MGLLEPAQVDEIQTEFQLRKEELKVRLEMAFLYEERTRALQAIAQALGYQNERKFHTT